MNLDEAKRIILVQNDNSRKAQVVAAAATLCSQEHACEVTTFDLLQCMRRGNGCRELPQLSEYAALALYQRTKRPRASHVPYEDFVTDAENWDRYLKAQDMSG